jgi:hypothetical protein
MYQEQRCIHAHEISEAIPASLLPLLKPSLKDALLKPSLKDALLKPLLKDPQRCHHCSKMHTYTRDFRSDSRLSVTNVLLVRCMYVYMHKHLSVHGCIDAYIRTSSACICVRTCRFACSMYAICMYTIEMVRKRARAHTHTHTHTHTCKHARIH